MPGSRDFGHSRPDYWDAHRTGERDNEGDPKTYKVVRHRFKGEKETIKTGLTLEEAQEHCGRDDTHGEGWFDGYTEE